MIGRLIGIRLRALFATMSTKKKDGTYKKPSVGKIILIGILMLYILGVFVGLSLMIAISLALVMVPAG